MSNVPVDEVLEALKRVYEESVPFNKLIGMKIETVSFEKTIFKIQMREDLIGNFEKAILHGGVISAVLDFTGGVIAQLSALQTMGALPVEEFIKRLSSMSTIDIRIDFLRPGKGSYFRATGEILRTGKRVAVVRTEFRNDADVLIATGIGSYLIG